eukprot:TRINITY_DN2211_c0_g1_i5.p1 TRINITY_DN2211_c0_g1~~TRINITY_DN2211_c0_g1_i5.p1  ORF type:complete len:131 (-),score=11.81 TRINITY_DN2211_c0_g1_i5:1044-1436(-)
MHPLSQRNCNTRIQRSLAQNRRHSNTCYLTVRSVVYRMMHCSMPALASPHGAQQATSGIASMVQKVVGGTLELHSPARAAAPCVTARTTQRADKLAAAIMPLFCMVLFERNGRHRGNFDAPWSIHLQPLC